MSRIRTAILGYGRNGSTMHAGPIEKHSDLFEMVSVCDIDPAALKKAKDRFKCPVYEDYHKMLEEMKPELVVIVTRSYQHAQMAIDCLMAGSNVLVTKPMATNVPDAIRMIKAAEKSGKMLLPWLPARWGCDVKRLKEIVDAGTIGKVTEIHRSVHSFATRCDWQTELKYGGGYILNWGPHLIDQPIQLTNGKVKCVWADVKQLINPNDGEDDYTIITTTTDGVTVYSGYHCSIYNEPAWLIKGDRGTIVVRGSEIEINKATIPEKIDATEYRNKVEIETTKETLKGNCYGDEYEVYKHIAAAIKGECKYAVELDTALRLIRIIEAAKLSAQTHEAVMF